MLVLALQTTLSCLKDLYDFTGGESWQHSENWYGDDFCTFYGVECVDNEIHSLRLNSNNLVGSIPDCFAELPLYELDLSNNQLRGDFPAAHDGLMSFNIMNNMFTDFPSNWCTKISEPAKYKFYIAGNPITKVDVPVCILQSYYLNITGLKLVFLEETFIFNSTIFLAAGTDMHLVTANFLHISDLTELDISNTKLHSFPFDFFHMDKAPKLSTFEVGGAYIYLAGPFPPLVNKIDVSDCYVIQNNFNLTNLEARYTEFIARNASLQGPTPSIQEYEKFSKKRNTLIDISDNNFYCRADGQDAFDCEFFTIVNYNNMGGKISFYLKLSNNRHTSINHMDENFTVAIRNLTGVDSSVVDLIYYEECTIMDMGDVLSLGCLDHGEEDLPKTLDFARDVVILFNNEQVSTESLRVYEDIKKLLENPMHETFEDESQPMSLYENPFSSDYEMAVTAMSNCPDFKNFVLKTLSPFAIKYPELLKRFDFNYVAMSTPTGYYAEKATSMHGEREVFQDGLLACANHYSDEESYMSFLKCFEERSYDPTCVADIYEGGVARNIELCAHDEYIDFIAESYATNQELKSSWCPTMFLKNVNDRQYTMICSDCLFGPDELKRLLCQFMVEDHYPECEQ